MTLQELRLARKMAVEASTKIEDAAAEAKRGLTDEEKIEVDKRLVEHDELSAKIESTLEDQKRTAKLAEARANLTTPAPEPEARGNQPTTGQPGSEKRIAVPPVHRHSPGRLGTFTEERCRRLFGNTDISPRERAYRAGRFFGATLFQDRACQEWCEANGIECRAQAEDVNTVGGYLVIGEIDQIIIDLKEERGVFRRWAKIMPMLSDTKTFVSRASGVTATAMGEGETIPESTMGWSAHGLVARKWGTLSRFSNELGEDAFVNIGDEIAREIAYAFADKEDLAGFNGDGTKAFNGVTGATVKIDDGTHTAGVIDAASGNTAFSTLKLGDFEGVVGTLPQFAETGAAWFISKAGFAASMQRLMDAAGGNTIGDIAAGSPKQFLGFPVVISQVLNSTLTAQTSEIVALFGDMRLAATLGDRRGTTIAMSEHIYFASDQIGIRGTTRFDILVHQLGDTTDPGPLVALKTASS